MNQSIINQYRIVVTQYWFDFNAEMYFYATQKGEINTGVCFYLIGQTLIFTE